ncbi:prostacyclin synthase [Colletotrichum karsti]|uniref:Prostacyclin synthase n=1 Tax=Colletotrichum karsti TaxID=1095194 RepID=A0A9P6I2K6_9PEZI|nr:prostacyclin synthase [Colletotrichum karsti]KAF9876143.1 prostacyclin synthase [Colletotrichum karsti]
MAGPQHLDGASLSTTALTIAALILIPLIVVLKRLLFPVFDAREPPILRPKIPFFGHVFSLVREGANFNHRLYKEKKPPICTLPMLHGKMYLVNSPALIAAAMRNGNISFYPFQSLASTAIIDLPQRHIEKLNHPEVFHQIGKTMAGTLMKESLQAINAASLGYCSEVLNAFGETPKTVPAWDWVQEVMAMAAGRALYGRNNMWDVKTFEDLWIFDENLAILGANFAPNLLAPKAVAARHRMRALLRPFYADHLDENPDVASIVKGRANALRGRGIPSDELGFTEYLLPWAATTNTIPMTFWFLLNVFSKPEYVERIRKEVSAITTMDKTAHGGHDATLYTSEMETACPFLTACYREVLRLYVAQVSNRRVMEDLTLDDADGRQYLLKKDTNLQWATSVTHLMPEVWGDDVTTFRPERFLYATAEEERRRRGFMLPFGGGKHLCPGRFFAQTEITGFVAAMALGFDVQDVKVPPAGVPALAAAARHPAKGQGNFEIKISRRKDWENVNWRFVC